MVLAISVQIGDAQSAHFGIDGSSIRFKPHGEPGRRISGKVGKFARGSVPNVSDFDLTVAFLELFHALCIA